MYILCSMYYNYFLLYHLYIKDILFCMYYTFEGLMPLHPLSHITTFVAHTDCTINVQASQILSHEKLSAQLTVTFCICVIYVKKFKCLQKFRASNSTKERQNLTIL